jgi:hypothetical protein
MIENSNIASGSAAIFLSKMQEGSGRRRKNGLVFLVVLKRSGQKSSLIKNMLLVEMHMVSPERRDRLSLIHGIATVLLTWLGAVGESLGLDRYLKVNTVKKRTLSLFRQGSLYFERIPKQYVIFSVSLQIAAFAVLIISYPQRYAHQYTDTGLP